MKAIVIGRHELSGKEGLEVVDQKNINFPATSQECEPIIRQLLEDAKAEDASLIFQAMPAQVSATVADIVDNDTAYNAGAIVSVPGERPAGSVEVFESDHPFVAEQIAEAVKFANPRAKVVIEGLSCKVTVDPPMRFKFSHIEWF